MTKAAGLEHTSHSAGGKEAEESPLYLYENGGILEECELSFQTCIDTMLDCVSVCTAVRSEAGRIEDFRAVYVNAAACKALQLDKPAIIGKTLWELLPDTPLQLFYDFCHVVETGQPFVKEIARNSIRGKYNSIYDVRCARLNDGYIASWRNVTEQRRSQIEISRMDKLNLVGEMAANIGHEVRNPMTTVRGYLQLFQNDGRFTARQEQIQMMIEELDRANAIITEFLSLAQNKVRYMREGNLSEIVKNMVPLLQAEADRLDRRLEVRCKKTRSFLLSVNEMRQMIVNLVKNALEAVNKEGRVLLETYTEGDYAVLAVRDNGPGIAPAIYEKLGIPFVSTKEKGPGLGLPVCYRIAHRYKANLDVDTGPAGTNMYVRFPAGKSSLAEQ